MFMKNSFLIFEVRSASKSFCVCEDFFKMSLIQNRAAVAPLNRHFSLAADLVPARHSSVAEMVAKLRPEEPLHCVRP